MIRDTRSAFRARLKATNDSVSAAVAEVREVSDASYRAAKDAHKTSEANRVKFTRNQLLHALIVTDEYGTYPVIRVNKDTVTVDGDFGPRRVRFDNVLRFMEAAR